MKCWKLTIDGSVQYFENIKIALAIAFKFKELGAKKITMKRGNYHA